MHNLPGKQCHIHCCVGNRIRFDAEQIVPEHDHICRFANFEGARFDLQMAPRLAKDGAARFTLAAYSPLPLPPGALS